MAEVAIRGVHKSYNKVPTVHGVDLSIADGEFVVLLGPSGCGKSTLLRMIAGLEEITAGEIAIDGTVVNALEPRERGCAMVFQNYALYPHMTVAENIGYALKVAGTRKPERRARVAAVAQSLGIAELLDRKPGTLSGGQRQRVAIGRAMIREPKVFLFDEPLSNLDAKLRAQMRIEIRRLHQRLGVTSVFVTHDQVEAMTLADRLVVLNHGRIEQIGTPTEVYRRPASRFVAGFIGAPAMNFLTGTLAADGRIAIGSGAGTPVTIGVRPDEIQLLDAPLKGTLDFEIELVEELGTGQVFYGRSGEMEMTVMRNGGGEAALPRSGQRLFLKIPMTCVHLFEVESGRRIDLPPSRLAAE
ncbi:ABC transporter ATP-binding protein [Dongia sedimenti]|uniref:Sn-glycerol-3-phosphate ABC transporter ATP-binding protein UgpC n=1 Tax=Dongia sedimenti TaxID=3064282 RepID=A0ABU0YQ38_9PROT|nr:sn-glycerol-3-phosphate ABC transporter ATP-binding protein UgpC [Rhodospirillaceae bacterium R-7]